MIPRQNTRELVDSVQSLLLQYAEYWPITIRQIFYRLVCTTGYPNTERAYRHLREKLHRVRVAGMLPHNAVRDDDVAIVEPRTFNTQLELVYSVADNADQFRLDRQDGQQRRFVFVIEPVSMMQQIERIAEPYGIPVRSPRSLDNLLHAQAFAWQLGDWPALDVLYLSEYDLPHEQVFSALDTVTQVVMRDLRRTGGLTSSCLAVTRQQFEEFNLPTAPPQEIDHRSEAVQIESMPPDVLARIVQDAIDKRFDFDVYRAVLERETHIRKKFANWLMPTALRMMGRP